MLGMLSNARNALESLVMLSNTENFPEGLLILYNANAKKGQQAFAKRREKRGNGG